MDKNKKLQFTPVPGPKQMVPPPSVDVVVETTQPALPKAPPTTHEPTLVEINEVDVASILVAIEQLVDSGDVKATIKKITERADAIKPGIVERLNYKQKAGKLEDKIAQLREVFAESMRHIRDAVAQGAPVGPQVTRAIIAMNGAFER